MNLPFPPAEPWFDAALARPSESRHASVHGARLHYRCWNMERGDLPALVLLHGFRAHARWWDFIAPFFAEQYRVIAPDFSGMGDSEGRPAYDSGTFAADITGLLEVLELDQVTAIGHSYGGSRLLRACADAPDRFRHAVLVDSYVQFAHETGPSLPRQLHGARTYADFAGAHARFRLMPEQANTLPFLVDYIARHALRETAAGWRWKFDPAMASTGYREADGAALLARIGIPVDFIHAEHSAVVTAQRAARTVAALSLGRGPVTIAHGQHHLMLDQPLALVSTLRTLLAARAAPATLHRITT